ncbi:endonuclease domain-containing protein [Salinimicrobium sp. HB62]|uniref:endonuclease domain-containing protein n=1 Tax=Salinimicrobium sp. HB62 TaxID=3077781 RepID=UPI002D777E84|nr:endonuclease domain-containing protein [Salinimicrobium sp. HB62]
MAKKSNVPSEKSPPRVGWPKAGVGRDDNILTTIDSFKIKKRKIPFLPAEKNLRRRARALRKMGNLPEIIFWQQVHKDKFHKIDFDRQRVIGNYIVDFYVKSLGLVIEIDGSSHNEKINYDEHRENYLKNLGLQVWKTTSTEVLMDVEGVMERLKCFIIDNYS